MSQAERRFSCLLRWLDSHILVTRVRIFAPPRSTAAHEKTWNDSSSNAHFARKNKRRTLETRSWSRWKAYGERYKMVRSRGQKRVVSDETKSILPARTWKFRLFLPISRYLIQEPHDYFEVNTHSCNSSNSNRIFRTIRIVFNSTFFSFFEVFDPGHHLSSSDLMLESLPQVSTHFHLPWMVHEFILNYLHHLRASLLSYQ